MAVPCRDVVKRLGSSSGTSVHRGLPDQEGLIFSPDFGLVDFTVPHFAPFMRSSLSIQATRGLVGTARQRSSPGASLLCVVAEGWDCAKSCCHAGPEPAKTAEYNPIEKQRSPAKLGSSQLRPRGLEPPRTNQSTRPSTRSPCVDTLLASEARKNGKVFCTDWTPWTGWMLPRVLPRIAGSGLLPWSESRLDRAGRAASCSGLRESRGTTGLQSATLGSSTRSAGNRTTDVSPCETST